MLVRSLWGFPTDPDQWKNEFIKLKQNGFVGVEASLSDIKYFQDKGERFVSLIRQEGLEWICGLYTSWRDYEGLPEIKSVQDHLSQLEQEIVAAIPLKPRHINCHAGSDDMTLEDSINFFKQAMALVDRLLEPTGITLSFETHRGRVLYSPWIALQILSHVPDLPLTLDLSHWVLVTEQLPPLNRLEPLLANVLHIHARIGTKQASQVSNPARMDPRTRDYFEQVWQRVLDHRSVLFCIEYGPWQDGYQPTDFQGNPEFELNDLIFQEGARLKAALLNK